MKTALAATCVLVLLAIGYLSLSLVVLDPPRARVTVWFALAAVLTAQCVLTLIALNIAGPPASLRMAVLGGAVVVATIAVWRVRATLTSPHVEGHNLLLGAMLVVQAALTMIVSAGEVCSRGLSR
jgi:hypothetical protein